MPDVEMFPQVVDIGKVQLVCPAFIEGAENPWIWKLVDLFLHPTSCMYRMYILIPLTVEYN